MRFKWWHIVIFVAMVLVYGVAGSEDLRDRERTERMLGASYVARW